MGRPVVFFDIGCEDKDNTVKFYTKLFGWNSVSSSPYSDTMDTGSEDGIIGAITALGHEPHSYCMIYVEVEDIDAYLEKAQEMGGETIIAKTENPNDGQSFAWVADPEGTIIGLLESAE